MEMNQMVNRHNNKNNNSSNWSLAYGRRQKYSALIGRCTESTSATK